MPDGGSTTVRKLWLSGVDACGIICNSLSRRLHGQGDFLISTNFPVRIGLARTTASAEKSRKQETCDHCLWVWLQKKYTHHILSEH